MGERGERRYITLPRVVALAAASFLIADASCGCEPDESIPPIEARADDCVDLTANDTVTLQATPTHDHGEESEAADTIEDTPVVAVVRHPLGSPSEDDELVDGKTLLERLAACYAEDPDDSKQLLASMIAGGTNNTDTDVFAILTSPVQVDTDEVDLADLAEELKLSQQVLESAQKASEAADLGRLVLPVQPEIAAPKGGGIDFAEAGDTLTAIARDYNLPLSALLAVNASTDLSTLRPGHTLRVPAPVEAPKVVDITEQRRLAAQSFIDQYGQTFKEVIGDKLPLDAVIAQALRESGFGTSELAVGHNNFFGMKAKSDWTGDTHTKFTTEEVPIEEAEGCVENEGCRLVEDLGNGRAIIEIPSVFRAYPSLKAGIEDYVKKIEEMYPNVATAKGENYARELINEFGNGKYKWASDSAYAEGVNALLRIIAPQVAAIPNEDEPVPTSTTTTTTPETPKSTSRIPRATEDAVETSQKFLETLESVSFSQERYEAAIANMYDASYLLDEFPKFKGKYEVAPIEFITQHYTVSRYKTDSDEVFARHMMNAMSGGGTGTHFAVMESGKLVRFTDEDLQTRPAHNPPYDTLTLAIEYVSPDQAGISKEQIENGIYLNLYLLDRVGLADRDYFDTIIGHADARNAEEIRAQGFDVRLDWPTIETNALRAKMNAARAAGIGPR